MTGDEHRHSFGSRWFGVHAAWNYIVKPVVEFGTVSDRQILAWTIANVVGYIFERITASPRLGVKSDVISGDRSPDNGQLGTFNAMLQNKSYFGEAAFFAPANLYDLNLSVELKLTDRLTFVVLIDFLWRLSTEDAIYAPPGTRPSAEEQATHATSVIQFRLLRSGGRSIVWKRLLPTSI